MNTTDKLDFLQIQEVTTDKQKANGTREFKLPMNDPYGVAIHVASFASGYVRRTKTGGYSSDWQLNKTKKEKRYVEMTDHDTGRPVIRTFHDTVRILIPDEQDRLDYLIAFCLKNYYINQANKLSNGDYIPKWKHEDKIEYIKERYDVDRDNEEFISRSEHRKLMQEQYINGSRDYSRCKNPEVKVIVNGHRYNVI
jgi:hypothetical protein